MKKFIVILLSNFIFTISFAQTDAAYRIFGEIMTVENKVYKGFITWNGNKNYWIDFFEASKIENPYRSYFKRSDGLVFRANEDRKSTRLNSSHRGESRMPSSA